MMSEAFENHCYTSMLEFCRQEQSNYNILAYNGRTCLGMAYQTLDDCSHSNFIEDSIELCERSLKLITISND
jgi:hypothetical protein